MRSDTICSDAEMIGFGGMDDVRFRGMVVPGDRLVVDRSKAAAADGRNDPLPLSMLRARAACLRGRNSRHPDPRGRAIRTRVEPHYQCHALSALRSESAAAISTRHAADHRRQHRWSWVGSARLREIDQSNIAAEYGFVPGRLTHLGSGKADQRAGSDAQDFRDAGTATGEAGLHRRRATSTDVSSR